MDGLQELALRHPDVTEPRGRGLMCAITLASAEQRDALVTALREREHVLILGTGERGIRFRPGLTVTMRARWGGRCVGAATVSPLTGLVAHRRDACVSHRRTGRCDRLPRGAALGSQYPIAIPLCTWIFWALRC